VTDDMLTITAVCGYGDMGKKVADLTGRCELVSASHAFIAQPVSIRRSEGAYDTSRSVVSLLVVIRGPKHLITEHKRLLEAVGLL
jgi:hypothetical protein